MERPDLDAIKTRIALGQTLQADETVPALIAYIEYLEARPAEPSQKLINLDGQTFPTRNDTMSGSALLQMADCSDRWQLFYQPRGERDDVQVQPDAQIPLYDGMVFRRVLVDINGS